MTLFALLFSLVLFSPAHAIELEAIELEIAQFQLEGEKGEGEATRLDLVIAEGLKTQSYRVRTQRTDQNMRIYLGPVSILWRNIPRWLQANLTATLLGANIRLSNTADHLVTAQSLSINAPSPEKIELEGLKLECQKSETPVLRLGEIFADCVRAGELTASRIDSADLERFLKRVFPFLSGKLFVRNPKLSLSEGDYQLRLFTSLTGGVDVTSSGAVHFDPQTLLLEVRIDQFRFGYIPMRAALLRVLRTFYADKVAFIRGNTIGIQL